MVKGVAVHVITNSKEEGGEDAQAQLVVPDACCGEGMTIDTIYIKTQVFRLLRYYSPAPRNVARSDWATQNITHNMTS